MSKKTGIQKLWDKIDRLEVMLSDKPEVAEAHNLVLEIEEDVKLLRKREVRG